MFVLGKPEKQLKFLGAGPRAFWDRLKSRSAFIESQYVGAPVL
jgi:hypothetical protein